MTVGRTLPCCWILSSIVACGGPAPTLRVAERPEVEQPAARPDARERALLGPVDRDAITALAIRRPRDGGGEVRLVREGDGWRLTAPVEAPASRSTVEVALDRLQDLDIVMEPAAGTAEDHERLGVDRRRGVHVVAMAGDQRVFDAWIGGFHGGSTMVRAEGEAKVRSARGAIRLAFDRSVADWRDRDITDLDPDRLVRLSFHNPAGTSTFERSADGWAQAQGDAAIGDFDPARVSAIAASLARLRAVGFAAEGASPDALGLGSHAPRVELGLSIPEGSRATVGETVVVLVGGEAEDGQRYVMVRGRETIYRVTAFLAERLLPDAGSFSSSGGAAAPAGDVDQEPQQIPPELMRQIQEQLRRSRGGDSPD